MRAKHNWPTDHPSASSFFSNALKNGVGKVVSVSRIAWVVPIVTVQPTSAVGPVGEQDRPPPAGRGNSCARRPYGPQTHSWAHRRRRADDQQWMSDQPVLQRSEHPDAATAVRIRRPATDAKRMAS